MLASDVGEDAELASRVALSDYRARIERVLRIRVVAFDWNCPQHITPRFTEAELNGVLIPVRERMAEIEAENASLRQALATAREDRP